MGKKAAVGELIGKCFVVFGKDRKPEHQGVVVGRPEPGFYLVQYFDFIIGDPSTFAVFSIQQIASKSGRELGAFEFFEDDEHLRAWMKNYG